MVLLASLETRNTVLRGKSWLKMQRLWRQNRQQMRLGQVVWAVTMFSPIILLGGLQSLEGHTSTYNSILGGQKVLRKNQGRLQHNPKNGQKPMSQGFMERRWVTERPSVQRKEKSCTLPNNNISPTYLKATWSRIPYSFPTF